MKVNFKEARKYPIIILFLMVIFLFALMDIVLPDKSFSAMENRYLAQKPELTWSALLSNKFSAQYEEYINDQFVARDQWISVKSLGETVLGKIENNNIVYGSDNYMFEKYLTVNQTNLNKNITYVQQFLNLYDDKNIYFSLIPSGYMVLDNKIPQGLPNINQNLISHNIYQIAQQGGATVLDFYSILQEHQHEYIYYRTDHHWTTLGAYYAYQAYCQAAALNPVDLQQFEAQQVKDFYGTYYSKSKRWHAVADEITYYDLPVASITVGGEEKNGLYDESKFATKDKYAGLLHSNNGLTIIQSANPQAQGKLLVIKDSFANSFVPYLTANYQEIIMVDLRYLGLSLKQVIADNDIDDILLMYNFINFADDTNVAKLKY